MRSLAAIAFAPVLLGAPGFARAGEPTVALEHADVAQACPLDDVRARVTHLVGRDAFAEDPDVVVRVATRMTASGVEATLEAQDGSARVITASDCDDLATSVAIAVVLLLEVADMLDAPAAVEPPPPVESPVPAAAETRPFVEETAVAEPPAARLSVAGDLLVGGAGGLSRGNPVAQLVVGGRVRSGSWSLGLEMAFAPAEQLTVSLQGRVSVSTIPLVLTPCGRTGAIAICAALTGGWTHGVGSGLVDARAATVPFAAAGARTEWEYRLSPRFGVRVHADASRLLTTTRYLVDQMPVWTSPRYEARVGIGVASQIP